MKRLLVGQDVQLMTPERRLRFDLLYAVSALPFSLLLGLLLHDKLTSYPLRFGGTWFILGTVVALGRYFRSRLHPRR